MPTIESALDLRSPGAHANAKTMRGLVADLRETAGGVRIGGGQATRERHLARGKLLPRDRIRALIDSVSPFLKSGSSPLTAFSAARRPRPGSSQAAAVSPGARA